jgi:hypothetical protein
MEGSDLPLGPQLGAMEGLDLVLGPEMGTMVGTNKRKR